MGDSAPVDDQRQSAPELSQGRDFALERYKFILQQIHATNENTYRFLAIYQTLATTLSGAALALFVNWQDWGVTAPVARATVVGLMALTSLVACFTVLQTVVGALNWLDYRREECELTDEMVYPGFRSRPSTGNYLRWYETYIVIFIVGSVLLAWLSVVFYFLPALRG